MDHAAAKPPVIRQTGRFAFVPRPGSTVRRKGHGTLGTDFPYRQFYPEEKSARVVQIDIRPEQLGRRTGIDLGLVGDVKATLKALLPLIEPNGDSTRGLRSRPGRLHGKN